MGTSGSRAFISWAKAMEGAKSLEVQPEEPAGVGGAERAHSLLRNRRGPSRPGNARAAGCHPAVPGRGDAYKQRPCEVAERRAEVGGGHSSEEGRDNITRPERMASSQVGVPVDQGWRNCHRASYPPGGIAFGLFTRLWMPRGSTQALGQLANPVGSGECLWPTARGRAV